ncbi:unnamed protein product [Coregonus sp. 'balchen']|nr:unnamed protein product [Coregonus sp. 'balchen']
MNKQQETWEKLDSEFDHHLVDMKPYVLKLHHKTERQRCALWIKKLCDPAVSGSGLMGRKNRNMYSRLLLHMLRRGVLEGPSAKSRCISGLSQHYGELGQGDDSWESLLRERASSSPTAYSNTHRNGDSKLIQVKRSSSEALVCSLRANSWRRRLYEEKSPSRPLASSPVKRSSEDHNKGVSSTL